MRTEKVKKGARLLAKWPDTQYYYWCTIIEQVGDKWKVEFADGTLADIEESDLHESLPDEALNIVGRVTRSSPKKQGMDRSPTKQVMRSSPTKQRKRPDETRRSPARKVRKLFTDEENVKLGAELKALIETAAASGTEAARPPSTERSVNVPEETEELQKRGNSHDSGERSRSATIELEDSSDSTASTACSGITNNPPIFLPIHGDLEESSDSQENPPSVLHEKGSSTDNSQSDLEGSTDSGDMSPSLLNEKDDSTDNSQSAASVSRPSHERSVSVSRETSDVMQRALGVESSPFRKTGSVTRETRNVICGASGVQSSPFKKTGSVTRETSDVTRAATNVRSSPFRRSVSITKDAGSAQHGAADARPSPLKSSYAVDIQKESLTRSVTRYTESYLDRDGRRRLLIEGPIGSSDLRSSPFRSNSPFHERRTVTPGSSDLRSTPFRSDSPFYERRTPDLKTYTGSYLDRDFRSQPLKECTVGSADLRPSPSRISMLNERAKVISDLRNRSESQMDRDARKQFGREGSVELKKYGDTYLNRDLQRELGREGSFDFEKYTDSYLDRDFWKQLGREPTVGSSGVQSSPCRRSVSLTKDNKYLTSGIYAFVLTLVVTISACYYQRDVAAIVITIFNEAAVSAMFLGIILALILYKRADKLPVSYLNPYGCTGYKLYDFWMGREMTPRIGKFNIKQILHRFSIIIAVSLNVMIVAKAYFEGEEEDLLKSLMAATIMQSLYCLHFLFHEDIYLYSFLAVSEGVGYMIAVGFMIFPFMVTLTTKLILEYRLKASLTEICIALCAYTIGNLLLELSSQKKTLSVRDPITSVWKMKVPEWNPKIHTTAYLGEIITYWSFTLVAGTTYPGLFIVPAALTVGVLSRAFREYTRAAYQGDEGNNKQ